MEHDLLNSLISGYGRNYTRIMEDNKKPLIADQPWRYFPKKPAPRVSDFESWLASSFGSAGSTNTWTGAVDYDSDLRANAGQSMQGQESFLKTMVHENYHHKRRKLSSAAQTGLINRSKEVMGEQGYRKLMDEFNPSSKYWLYKLQSLMPFLGQKRMDEEGMAEWIGRSSVGHSKESLREALKTINPKMWDLYDMHTQGLDFIAD
jgi:hypothetical protein